MESVFKQIRNIFGKRNKLSTVYITDDATEQKVNEPLPKVLFSDLEYSTLKEFCFEKQISQKQINVFHTQFIEDDPSKLKINLIRCSQIKQKFKFYSLLIRELADILIPPIFYRNYTGLLSPYLKLEEISLARFVIMSYIFGGQHILDTVYDFIASLMQNMSIKLSATILSYNFEKIMLVLIDGDDKTKSSSVIDTADCNFSDVVLRILKPLLNTKNDIEITVEMMLRIAVKFPILFYKLAQFQRTFQHNIFGEKYWLNQKTEYSRIPLKIRLENFDIGYINYDITTAYSSEKMANQQSAQSVINDAIYQASYTFLLTPHTPPYSISPSSNILSEEGYFRLKQIFGYKITSELIRDSGYICDQAIAIVKLNKELIPHTSTSMTADSHNGDNKSLIIKNSFPIASNTPNKSSRHVIAKSNNSYKTEDIGSKKDMENLNLYECFELPSNVPETNKNGFDIHSDNEYIIGEGVGEFPDNSFELSQYSNVSNNTNKKVLTFRQGDRTFSYDVSTGEKKWIVRMRDEESGNVVKEFNSLGKTFT